MNPRVPGNRLQSLDVFRGATLASMVLVNNPGSWDHIYPQLEHAAWHGWTFTDTVFPFFLWIAGVALTLSFAKRVERGDGRLKLFFHVLRRSLLIFAVGLFLNGFPYFHLDRIRYLGVKEKRSEEHTSELQSHLNLVCRLLLEKKKLLNDIRSPTL